MWLKIGKMRVIKHLSWLTIYKVQVLGQHLLQLHCTCHMLLILKACLDTYPGWSFNINRLWGGWLLWRQHMFQLFTSILPVCHFIVTSAHSPLVAQSISQAALVQIRCMGLGQLHTTIVLQPLKQLVLARTGIACPFPFLAVLWNAQERWEALLLVWEALTQA